MTVPVEHEGLFVRASHEAIDAVHAPGLEADLRRFHEHHAATGKHSGAWANVDVSRTIDGLRKTVSGIEIDTYGGPKGWFPLTFSGNLAYDGTSEGPSHDIIDWRVSLTNPRRAARGHGPCHPCWP